ncbi:MAG: nucleotide-binding universal stress UspA family protein [Planctomycetaceae bacterium]|jgi:nucleotide-binding universal stress UspA family protein
MKINHILVPTDFIGPAREVTDYAVGLARAFGAALTLFHVIEVRLSMFQRLVDMRRRLVNWKTSATRLWPSGLSPAKRQE